jgi:MFS family permease
MLSRSATLWALTVIFVANFLNYLDRTLVSALEIPLSEALDLNDEQFGFLWTLFTIGYMVCAVPIGLLADRYSRTRLFAVCIVVWSVATIASGLAPSKEILYVARVFIGVGEAGCLVIGPAMLSDLFSPRVRGRALAIFYLGVPPSGTPR